MKLRMVLGFLLVCGAKASASRRLVTIAVPALRARGEPASLACDYDLTGRLYSVKWYRDNEEFYRYIPKARPPQLAHALDGVVVDMHKSSARRVHLQALTLRSRGLYRCEVSEEAPAFHSAEAEAFMEVYYFPREPPSIAGHTRPYRAGERLDLNCTAPAAFPAPELVWHVNGKKAPESWVVRAPAAAAGGGLLVSRLGLAAPAAAGLRARCVALVGTHRRERTVVIETNRSSRSRLSDILPLVLAASQLGRARSVVWGVLT